MARSEEEDDTAAIDAADAERASSMMRKWDLPHRLLCVYHYSNGSASKADGADVTYPQPGNTAAGGPGGAAAGASTMLHFLTRSHPVQGAALPEWEHRTKEGDVYERRFAPSNPSGEVLV